MYFRNKDQTIVDSSGAGCCETSICGREAWRFTASPGGSQVDVTDVTYVTALLRYIEITRLGNISETKIRLEFEFECEFKFEF